PAGDGGAFCCWHRATPSRSGRRGLPLLHCGETRGRGEEHRRQTAAAGMDTLDARHGEPFVDDIVAAALAVRPAKTRTPQVRADIPAVGAAHGEIDAVLVLAAILALDRATTDQQ